MCSKILHSRSSLPTLHFFLQRGVLLAELGHFESATVDLKFAVKQISQLRQSKEVQITATKEQQVLDHLGGVYNRMGIRSFKKGSIEEAAALFTAALDCNPSVLTIYKNRAGKQNNILFILPQHLFLFQRLLPCHGKTRSCLDGLHSSNFNR